MIDASGDDNGVCARQEKIFDRTDLRKSGMKWAPMFCFLDASISCFPPPQNLLKHRPVIGYLPSWRYALFETL
jgi:hypothetical protein